jgi:hypothetical protein
MNKSQIFGLVSVALSITMCPAALSKSLPNNTWIAFADNSTCYYYKQDQLASSKSCKLTFNNKVGLQTLRMNWPDKTWSGIEKLTRCDFLTKPSFTADGYCRFFVNGRRALRYHRTSQQTQPLGKGHAIDEQGDITCYQVKETGNSICFKP